MRWNIQESLSIEKKSHTQHAHTHTHTHTNLPYFLNLAPEGFAPVFCDAFLCFSVPLPFCDLLLFFSPCPFVLFSPFCSFTAVSDLFCSPLAACFSPFCPLFGAFPFFFIKKRGVVQIVLRLGGLFSSLRFTLLKKKINKKKKNTEDC